MTHVSKKVPPSLEIQPDWEEVWGFSEGLAVVRVGGKDGYINENGEWTISPRFDYAGKVLNGFSCIKDAGRWGIINTKGDLIGDRYFDEVTAFKDGKSWVRSKDEGGSLDAKGNLAWVRSMAHLPIGYLSENYDKMSDEWIRSL